MSMLAQPDASHVIDTSGTMEETDAQVRDVWAKLTGDVPRPR